MSPSYTAEFKAQVIHEVQEMQNATVVTCRRPLSPRRVRRWSREACLDTGKSPGGLSLAEENAQRKRLVIDRDLPIAVLQDIVCCHRVHLNGNSRIIPSSRCPWNRLTSRVSTAALPPSSGARFPA